jgi:hypothetical protein
MSSGQYQAGIDDLSRALQMDPQNVRALGDLDQSIGLRDRTYSACFVRGEARLRKADRFTPLPARNSMRVHRT